LEKGTDATTIAEIAARAGCSVGTVYHHFKDKKALFFALFHRMTEAYQALNQAVADPAQWQGATIADLLHGYLEISLNLSRQAAAKAAASAVVADHPELAAHYAEIQASSRRIVLNLILDRRREIGRADADAAAAFVIDQMAAMLRARVDPSQRAVALQDIDEEDFIANVVHMVSDYLELKPTPK
jgi:AcrR family transcriptional regulator